MKLIGKVALITGASRGIGKSVAEGFAREGAKLFLVGHTDEEALRQTLADIRQSGTEAEGGLYDVGIYDEVRRIADAIGGGCRAPAIVVHKPRKNHPPPAPRSAPGS